MSGASGDQGGQKPSPKGEPMTVQGIMDSLPHDWPRAVRFSRRGEVLLARAMIYLISGASSFSEYNMFPARG